MVDWSNVTALDVMVAASVLLTLAAASSTYLGWSWGGSGKGKKDAKKGNWWESGASSDAVPKANLTSTPGVTVAKRVSATSPQPDAGSRSPSDGRSSWERSKAKAQHGYYYAHHGKLPSDGLKSEDYEMNRPKPLGTKVVTARRPTKITRYTYEDTPAEVRLEFRNEEWDWSEIPAEELSADWTPTTARLTIDSAKYGLHEAAFASLRGEITGVAVRKLKRGVRLVLAKARPGQWTSLQGPAAPPRPAAAAAADDDGEEPHELAVD